MAKNIDFMGAVFPDVPSVKLPQQGGGLVAFDDTTDATATADKILQGYTAYAGGQKLTGTASGGITPSGTMSITSNGTYDVTQYASADVNVSGGGGSGLTLLDEQDFAVTKPASSGFSSVGSITNSDFIVNKPLYIRVRDKNGKPANLNYYGSDIILVNHNVPNGTSGGIFACAGMCIYVNSSGVYASIDGTTNNSRPSYGIYATQLSSGGKLSLSARTNANTAMDSTYTVQVYSIDLPIA